MELEYIERSDWEGLSDECPECEGSEYNHMRFQAGLFGQYQGGVIERKDYWDQKGSLYTECIGCDEVLYKHPAYDLIENWFDELDDIC